MLTGRLWITSVIHTATIQQRRHCPTCGALGAWSSELSYERVERPASAENCADDFGREDDQTKGATYSTGARFEDVNPLSSVHCHAGHRDQTQKHVEPDAEHCGRYEHSSAQKYHRGKGNQRSALGCREQIDAGDEPNPRGPPASGAFLFVKYCLKRIGCSGHFQCHGQCTAVMPWLPRNFAADPASAFSCIQITEAPFMSCS